MSASPNRVFHYAVLASLALYAVLFVAFPDLLDTARRAVRIPPLLIALLMAPEAPPAAAVPAEEARPEALPPKKSPKPITEKPVQRIEVPASPASVAAPPIAAAEPQPATPAAAPAAPAAPPAQAAESLSRDQYRVQLIDEARRHKRYPALARENNWQGNVLVGVVVGRGGRAAVTLKGSSGHEVLDRQALDMFRQAARAVPVPAPLRGKEFALEVRAVYGLED